MEDSAEHGWPHFRDKEVVWENVRAKEDNEIVTIRLAPVAITFPKKISTAGKPK